MPCNYTTHATENLIAKKYYGRLTRVCVLDLLDRVEADPLYVEGMREFADLRDVTELDVKPEDVEAFADLIKGLNLRRRQPSLKAVLVASDETRVAAEKYMASIADAVQFKIGIFTDFDDAMVFLRLAGTTLAAQLEDRRLTLQ